MKEAYGLIGQRARLIRWELAILGVFWLLSFFQIGLTSFITYGPTYHTVSLSGAISDLGFIGVLLWIAWMSGDDLSMFGLTMPKWREVALWPALVVILVLGERVGLAGFPVVLHTDQFSFAMLGIQFLLYLVPAFFEELFCRGIMQVRIAEILRSPWLGIVGSAIPFALVHIYQGTDSLLPHTVYGIILGWARYKGVSLFTLALAHALGNAALESTRWVFMPY